MVAMLLSDEARWLNAERVELSCGMKIERQTADRRP